MRVQDDGCFIFFEYSLRIYNQRNPFLIHRLIKNYKMIKKDSIDLFQIFELASPRLLKLVSRSSRIYEFNDRRASDISEYQNQLKEITTTH